MKVTKEQILQAINNTNSYNEAHRLLNINYKTFRKYCIDLQIEWKPNYSLKNIKRSKSYTITLEDIFKGKYPNYQTFKLKNRLIKELKWQHICSICKLQEWNNEKIPLQLDHINGVSNDHRLENLRLLCPNCHAQTETYCGKNVKRRNTIVSDESSE